MIKFSCSFLVSGYSSLVKDMYGLRLFASCTDDKIYEYNIHNYSDKPGMICRIQNF